MICPYCEQPARWCDNAERYGKRYGNSYMCYWCKECDAYVGCHNNTRKPLGTMANKELREWRMKAHAAFDPLWESGKMPRGRAYRILANVLGSSGHIHIGESDVATCERIVAALTSSPPND